MNKQSSSSTLPSTKKEQAQWKKPAHKITLKGAVNALNPRWRGLERNTAAWQRHVEAAVQENQG